MHEFIKENPRGMKSTSNKREIRISAGSKNQESTVRTKRLSIQFTVTMILETLQDLLKYTINTTAQKRNNAVMAEECK